MTGSRGQRRGVKFWLCVENMRELEPIRSPPVCASLFCVHVCSRCLIRLPRLALTIPPHHASIPSLHTAHDPLEALRVLRVFVVANRAACSAKDARLDFLLPEDYYTHCR